MCCYAHGARKEQKAGFSPDHGRTVVPATNRDEPVTVESSSSFGCVVEIKRALYKRHRSAVVEGILAQPKA